MGILWAKGLSVSSEAMFIVDVLVRDSVILDMGLEYPFQVDTHSW